MSAYFITSCGTERGKTYVAELLIRGWLREGLTVDVLKPIVSGFEINTWGEAYRNHEAQIPTSSVWTRYPPARDMQAKIAPVKLAAR